MAIDALQVQADYRWKLQIERFLAEDVNRLWVSTARQYTREIRARGWYTEPDEAWGDALEQMLVRQYERTSGAFGHRIGAQLPAGVKPTSLESDRIDEVLARTLSERAGGQRALIGGTTRRNMDDALTAARRASQTIAAETGISRSAEEEALEAGRTLERRLRGRTSGIASLETQAPSEMAKLVETEILLGHTPSIEGGTYAEPEIVKTWWSIGDDVVREDHLMADQQEQELQEPFLVGPDQLMAPGDTSLGAPIGQVIHCRCSSVVDVDEVAEQRASRGLGE